MLLLDRLLGKAGWRFTPATADMGIERTRRLVIRKSAFQGGYLDPSSFISAVMGTANVPERLHIFSLGDFREAAGSKWDRIAGMVELASDNILRRHIDLNTDIYTRIDAETTLLFLPRSSRQKARACITGIARDLARHLFGDSVIAGRRPQVVTANIPMKEALAPDNRINTTVIREAAAKAGPAFALSPRPPGAAGQADLHRTSLADLIKEAEVVSLTAEAVSSTETSQCEAPLAAEPKWENLHICSRPAEAPTEEQKQLSESVLSLVWTPTWTTDRQAVSAFKAQVIRDDGKGQPLLEGVHAYGGTSSFGALTIDRFVAAQAALEMREYAFVRQQMELILPIHCSSLATHWRDYLMTPLNDCSGAFRRKLLKIEVFGLPPSIAAADLHDRLNPLEALGCDLLVRLPLSASGMAADLTHLRAVGIDLAELKEDDRVGDDELFLRLHRFQQTASHAGYGCYLWGVRRRPLIAKLLRAGIAMVNGPGIMSDIGHPYASVRTNVPIREHGRIDSKCPVPAVTGTIS
ncbi:MAG: hypothetical protein HQL37_04345 [Alphaproteobacteria bacterium]|nr:hypothetical protein [Alphaproteobacteria bacterium]